MQKKVFFTLTLLLVVLGATHAQTDTLTHLSPIDGRIDSTTPEAVWTISLREGAMVSFWAQPMDNTFDPILRVTNANGDTLMRNDDYDPPLRLDARIEGFTAPQTAQYNVVVTGANGSTGIYRLHMMLGYSEVVLWDNFGGAPNLTPINASQSNSPRLAVADGALVLQQDGIQQTMMTLHQNANAQNFYMSATVKSIAYRTGWQFGFIVRYQDPENYALILLNQQGNWRFIQRQEGRDNIVRDWTSHPAIIADKTTFRLDVLANDAGFEVFYDGQVVGNVISPAPPQNGQVGFIITTANALDGTVTATLDDLILTVSARRTDSSRLHPEAIIVGSANFIARQLMRTGVIPPQSEQALTLASSEASYNLAGVSRVPLARSSTFNKLLYIATVTWQSNGQGVGGCGLTAHDVDPNTYLLAYVDSAGGYGISQRDNEQFTQGFWGEFARSSNRAHLVWMVTDKTALLYINGVFVGELAHTTSAGRIGNAVVHFDTLNTVCTFSDVSLWRWE